MAMLDLRSILVKGDVGTNIVRDGKTIQLQGIEADRIGNPYDYSISNNYVRGLEVDEAGRIAAARVFYRDRPSGTYKYEQTIPVKDERGLPRFLFLVNPISYDDYRGVSVFKTAIDNATYIDRIREYELQALMWAASQSGVFHTKSGALPEGLPFDRNPLVDSSGNAIETYQVRPNTVTALGVGEDVAMFQHDRPSPNVLGILEQTVRDISVGTGLSYGLVWDMSGYTGPAVRAISSQDARTIETWQWLLREGKLDPVALLVLGNAIANGELPYHPLWMKWEWFFPAKSTIDVGRESDANINEIHAGINTGARVAADDGFDIEEIKLQRGREIEAEIQVAMEVAKNVEGGGEQPVMWQEIYQLMYPRPGKGGGMMPGAGGGGGFPPGGDGGTDGGRTGGNGARTAGRNGGGNGKKEMRVPMVCINGIWYREDQARDEGGRFADEGGGEKSPGRMTADPEDYAKAQLEGIAKGKPGVSKEKVNMQPAFVHRDDEGNAVGIARFDESGVSDLAVAKEHRGRGVATGLLDAVKAEGVNKGKGPMSPEGEKTARAAGLEIVPAESSDEAAVGEREEL
jgi:GNAT superfamily N-acetyltransferase